MTTFQIQIILGCIIILFILANILDISGFKRLSSSRLLGKKNLIRLGSAIFLTGALIFFWETKLKPFDELRSPKSKYFKGYKYHSEFFSYRNNNITKLASYDEFIDPLVILGDWLRIEEEQYSIKISKETSELFDAIKNESLKDAIKSELMMYKMLGFDSLPFEDIKKTIKKESSTTYENNSVLKIVRSNQTENYTFDAEGRLSIFESDHLKKRYEYKDSDKIEAISTFEDNMKGAKDTFIYINDFDFGLSSLRPGGGVIKKGIYIHDEKGRPVFKESFIYIEFDDLSEGYKFFEYNENGMQNRKVGSGQYFELNMTTSLDHNYSLIEQTLDFKEEESPWRRSEYLYDKIGNWYFNIDYLDDGDIYLVLRKIIYKDGKEVGSLDLNDYSLGKQ